MSEEFLTLLNQHTNHNVANHSLDIILLNGYM